MRLIVDTNVFISGIFFSGPPYEILNAWKQGKIEMCISKDILEEYVEVSEELSIQYPEIDLSPFLELLTIKVKLVQAPPLRENVCTDPDDDMFLACAIASRAKIICSGDKALLKVSGYRGITVLKPRAFVDKFLQQ